MGQIKLPPSPPPPTEPSSSASDELPSYDQVATETAPPIEPYRDDPLAPPAEAYAIPGHQRYHSIFKDHTAGAVTLHPTFSTDPATLRTFVESQTRLPPRPCLVIYGTHSESRRDGKETKTESVTDFDFRIDLTRTLLRWGRDERTGPTQRWAYTVVVSDYDGQKAYRGGRWRTRSQKPGRIALPEGDEGSRLMDLEGGGENVPGIRGWCERFCNDPAPVKSFTFRRNLHGFDAAPMRTSLTSHIRSTGYQGHIAVKPAIANGSITIYSPHWINKLRNNAFVYWMCIVLQLWIVAWPIIWFLERRYEVVRSEWFSSQIVTSDNGSGKIYAGGMSEEHAAELWAPVVREAAWQGRRNADILGEAEIEELRRQGIQRREALGQGGDLVRRGQAMLGVMGIRSIGGVNVTGAWGRDTSSSSGSFSFRTG
ncbi:hypothetical protein BJX61DRAFT_301185 [Aspergillus egyptiacus]|nr:hypothetical protein BJX61DRAFT_301185 [Aspergillus egyptiacus]